MKSIHSYVYTLQAVFIFKNKTSKKVCIHLDNLRENILINNLDKESDKAIADHNHKLWHFQWTPRNIRYSLEYPNVCAFNVLLPYFIVKIYSRILKVEGNETCVKPQ